MTTSSEPRIKTFITDTGSRVSHNEVSHMEAVVVDVFTRDFVHYIERTPVATKLMLVLRDGSSVPWRTIYNGD